MCVYYRELNDCKADASWPIPNTAEMFRKIGSQKPKIFGIMDLTQGYHHASSNLATRAYTSFITSSGVYQFTRLPFGPKLAPLYFKEIMATVVLTGLIYMICESILMIALFLAILISNLFLDLNNSSNVFANIIFI